MILYTRENTKIYYLEYNLFPQEKIPKNTIIYTKENI
jgi:hypothetical protein